MQKNNLKSVTIYTDGSCLGNPGNGGWGAILIYNEHHKEISGGEKDTTNNRMELTAAIKALQYLKEKCIVNLYTDSSYVKNGITTWIHNWEKNNWKTSNKKPVKNLDLWQELILTTKKHHLTWKWVKAHNNNKFNEIADSLARNAAEKLP